MNRLSRIRIENQNVLIEAAKLGMEVEQVHNRRRNRVEGLIAKLPQAPVVLDEAGNRRLIGHRVGYEVDFRIGRDRQEREPRAIAAAIEVRARAGRAAQTARASCISLSGPPIPRIPKAPRFS
jgi:hypothetical protein